MDKDQWPSSFSLNAASSESASQPGESTSSTLVDSENDESGPRKLHKTVNHAASTQGFGAEPESIETTKRPRRRRPRRRRRPNEIQGTPADGGQVAGEDTSQ